MSACRPHITIPYYTHSLRSPKPCSSHVCAILSRDVLNRVLTRHRGGELEICGADAARDISGGVSSVGSGQGSRSVWGLGFQLSYPTVQTRNASCLFSLQYVCMSDLPVSLVFEDMEELGRS